MMESPTFVRYYGRRIAVPPLSSRRWPVHRDLREPKSNRLTMRVAGLHTSSAPAETLGRAFEPSAVRRKSTRTRSRLRFRASSPSGRAFRQESGTGVVRQLNRALPNFRLARQTTSEFRNRATDRAVSNFTRKNGRRRWDTIVPQSKSDARSHPQEWPPEQMRKGFTSQPFLVISGSIRPHSHRNQKRSQVLPGVVERKDGRAGQTCSPCRRVGL